jgi:hypothetical protein
MLWGSGLASLLALLLVGLGWAAYGPLPSDTREEIFAIPKGTWARRMAGDKVEILPSEIRLTVGVKDILHLENQDDVPQIFGSVLIMPGQSFKLPFTLASEYQFMCTAHASGQMSIIVDPEPIAGWTRLAWRVRAASRYGRSVLEKGWV